MQKSGFDENGYLAYLDSRFTREEKNRIADSTSFQPPNVIEMDEVWQPLYDRRFPSKYFPALCCSIGEALHEKSGFSSIGTIYLASLYLQGNRIHTSGDRLESLAVRLSIDAIFFDKNKRLLATFADFLRWLIEDVPADPYSDVFFIKLGWVLISSGTQPLVRTDYQACLERIAAFESPNLRTDSLSCSRKWKGFIRRVGSNLGTDIGPLLRFAPSLSR